MFWQEEPSRIKETTDELSRASESVFDLLQTWKAEFLDLSMWVKIVAALILLTIFILIAKYLQQFLQKYINRIIDNEAASNIISYFGYIAVFSVGLIASLKLLELDDAVTGFLAGAGIAGVALGFAFQDTAANFISGTFMAFRKNFKVGDLIETNDVTAVVDQIDLRSTKLKTLDGYEITIPNKDVFQNKITNYNRYATRRIDLTCGVGYESDLEKVQRVTLDVINDIEVIKKTPSPQFFYTEFGDSSINYICRFWIDFLGMPDYLDAKHLAIKGIHKRYAQENINIPFPIRTLDFGKNDLSIHRVEKMNNS